MRVAIIGCGLIGHKRAKALGAATLVAVSDVDGRRAAALAQQYPGCAVDSDPRACVRREDVDLVIVSTTNNALAELTLAAVQAGKHVLVEKPAARWASELEPVVAAAKERGVVVKVGFNHRFHPAFLKARELVDAGAVGPLMYLRARYGHGGRVGYDKEWRADPQLSGGGELLDQGVHLIDLARWFLGEFTKVEGIVGTYFWNMAVEDNGFLALQTDAGQVAWLHASCSEWKNLFCFEIYGRDGKLQIDGLGGSYGVERLAYYKMLPQMGPPETTIWEYPGADGSWEAEFADLQRSLAGEPTLGGELGDGLESLRIVERVYQQNQPPAELKRAS